MVQYEQQRDVDSATTTTNSQWIRASGIVAILAGAVWALLGLTFFAVLNASELAIVDTSTMIAAVLLALVLPAYYASERHWFGRRTTIGFGLLAIGAILATIGLPADMLAGLGEVGFFALVLGVLIEVIGALILGVPMLRADIAPRIGAWLLVGTLPVGLVLTVGYSALVGQSVEPTAGVMVFYGLAWVVLGYHLWSRRIDTPVAGATAQ